ncbi:MAG: ATP-binding protein [Coriobacteriales bacterium]|jgi:hypothetical protein|nr:ATP-binding protein [Coriobacteriales bacterium]
MAHTSPNPFNPQFGKRPQQFVGRDAIINDFVQGLNDTNDPNRNTILTGIRGSGKTAILSDISALLDDKKTLVVDVTARDGMLLAILDEMRAKGKPWLIDWADGFTGFNVGVLGFSLGVSKDGNQDAHGFRYYLTEMLQELRKKKVATVFLIDEVHNKTQEMQEFATAYQHVVREGYNVALLMAGLPSSVHDVLNDRVLTFLRRAHRVLLESIDPRIIAAAFEAAFERSDKKASKETLRMAAEATKGYPYLFQLVGFYLWKAEGDAVKEADVERALEVAKVELFRNIHDIIYQELSEVDRSFLFAMAVDEDESGFGEIRERMGVEKGYASKYRQRLLDAGVVRRGAYGKLRFTPPYMREYLLQRLDDLE